MKNVNSRVISGKKLSLIFELAAIYMIQLDDLRWKDFDGGYRTPYDASIALKQLEKAESKESLEEIFLELWNELHHQGDVGLASYAAVPHLIRIAKERSLLGYHVFGLVATIEVERHDNNPALPTEFQESYMQAIKEGIPELVKMTIKDEWDITLSSTILSAMAVSKGQIEMAKVIMKIEDPGIIDEILDNY